MNPYYLNKRPEVAEFFPRNITGMRILEIGCGAGNFRANVVGSSEYWGIEPFQDVANIAAEKMDKVLVGTFKEVYTSLPDCYFDCVICADVIEHMEDEEWFFKIIKTKMKENSTIVGSIPNVRFIPNLLRLLIWKDWRYADSGILDRTHLRFFTQKSLLRMFHTHEYLVENFHGINPMKLHLTGLQEFFETSAMIISSYLLGRDSRYLQFGFRISQRQKNNPAP